MTKTTPRHTIDELRDHLFGTLDALRDKENPMDIARARTVSEVAHTIIESAKVEVEYMKTTKRPGTSFIGLEPPADDAPALTEQQGRGVTRTTTPHPSGLGTITRHTTR
jgi:hypothetical protein